MMLLLRKLSLRWRLVLTFMIVSAPAVLISSYIAASTISRIFQHNIEEWLDQTARFLANETLEARDEAAKSAAIIAAALTSQNSFDKQSGMAIQPFADLMQSVGYDLVKVYNKNGEIEYSLGAADLDGPYPIHQLNSIFKISDSTGAALVVGAVREAKIGGQTHYVFVANRIDDDFFNVSRAIHSLDIRVFRLTHNGNVRLISSGALHDEPFQIQPAVLAKLKAGASSVIAPAIPGDRFATVFSGLRDQAGEVVGIVSCRITGSLTGFESFSLWQLFAGLSLISGIVSALVGALFAERLSRPVRALTNGVRLVAGGDYKVRVAEEGGPELTDLATGFNTMTQQLERLRCMEQQMRHRSQLAALGEAAAVIAHEIRNPLGIIKTSTEIVRMKSALAPQEDRLAGFVLEEVARIDRLVQDVLDYVRPRTFEKVRLDLVRDIARKAVDAMMPDLTRRHITCTLINPSRPCTVLGDADGLYQALLNLMLNAADAMSEGGRLTISVGERDGQIELTVEDSGPGIRADVQERIFDPFFTTKTKGTGLGLAKVRATVENLDGSLVCKSVEGHGARFIIRLPAYEEAVAA